MSETRIKPSGSRRHFLRGAGVALALPMLDCFASDEPSAAPKRRMLLISNNLGVLPEPFFPVDGGSEYAMSPYLKVLEGFRQDFTVISGLSHPNVSGGHSTENCFLTSAKDPTGSGFRNTISLDQYATEQMGQLTRFPTLNLGVNIDRANRSLSWTTDGVLLPAEASPSAVFRKMCIQGNPADVQRRLHDLNKRGSVLDVLSEDMNRYERHVGKADRQRLDQYFSSIRQLEARLHTASRWEKEPKPQVDLVEPKDILDNAQFFEKFELMLSMAKLALETDSTRIVTLMVDAFATPVFQISSEEKSGTGYHNLSHHGQNADKIAQLRRVDLRQMQILRDLLQSLADVSDHGERLLDQTCVLFGSNMGDANVHNNTNLPILLAGGGFKHGQHLMFNRLENEPLCNLFVSMLQRLGIECHAFGSSTGTLNGLQTAGA